MNEILYLILRAIFVITIGIIPIIISVWMYKIANKKHSHKTSKKKNTMKVIYVGVMRIITFNFKLFCKPTELGWRR